MSVPDAILRDIFKMHFFMLHFCNLSILFPQVNLCSSCDQNQFGYHDGSLCSEEGTGSRPHVAVATGSGPSVLAGLQRAGLDPVEDPHCNGSLKKQPTAHSVEDSSGQRYSADPTVLLGEKGQREDTDEDGYMSPMKDKVSTSMFSSHLL